MRIFLIALLIVNLAIAAYIALAPQRAPESALLQQQVNSDRIRLVAPGAAPAATVPSAAPAPPVSACLEWGTIGGEEIARAREALADLNLGARLQERTIEETVSYWVYIPPLRGRQEVQRKVAELKSLGVTEYFVMQEEGKFQYAISLGVFKSEEAARVQFAKLQKAGVRSAQLGEFAQRVTAVIFVIRDPDDALTARLTELSLDFPESALRPVTCG